MPVYSIQAHNLSKRYGRNRLFRKLELSIQTGESLSICGPNGSGKTTLLKIIGTIIKPDKGSVSYYKDSKILSEGIINYIGYTGPLVFPYDELTGFENCTYCVNGSNRIDDINNLMYDLELYKHKDKKLQYYSSGMKQRLKFMLAVINNPPILLLDEPTSNIDEGGKNIILQKLHDFKKNSILVIATNDSAEASICDKRLVLND